MGFNMTDAMTAVEHIAALDLADPARDSAAERHSAVIAEITDFTENYAESNGYHLAMIPWAFPTVRDLAERLATDARAVFASDPSDELAYGATIDDESLPEGCTVAPDYCPDPPIAVPVALFRRNRVVRPAKCDGATGTLIPAVTVDAIERHYAFGSATLPAITAEALTYARDEKGCDLRLFAGGGQLHDSLTRQSRRSVWPIAHGEHLVILRYCSECMAVLMERAGIGPCRIETRWNIG